ncbi:MAG: hypothetical protein KA954_15320 [Chitinophagales bacterium]|nr:hypothetical protein [Chitinophagales bacterium]
MQKTNAKPEPMISKKCLSVILLCIGISNFIYGQLDERDREYGLNLGFSSFLGDLGGSNDIGRAFWWDIDPQVTRPAIGFVFRQEIFPRIAVRYNIIYSELRGDDALTNNEWRNNRNLSFKSPIVEGSVMIEVGLNRFSGPFKKKVTPYIYGGIGGFWFNPQAKYEGQWVELQPLGTEGQGLAAYPDKEKYSKIQACFPLGAGIRYIASNSLVFGFEMACRFTTTDYIDDVSGFYANPDYFFEYLDPQTASLAAALSDRSDGSVPGWTTPENGRGNPNNNDTYIFGGLFTLTYHFTTTKKHKSNLKCYFNEKN